MNIANYDIHKLTMTHQKKILLMGHGDGFGGAQTAFRELYKFIECEGHIVKVITLTNRTKKDQPFADDVVIGRIVHQGPASILRIKKIWGSVISGLLARRFKPDIFISVGLNNSANAVARFLNNQCFKIGQDFIAGRSITDPIWHASRLVLNGICVQAPSMLNYWRIAGIESSGINWLPCFPDPPVPDVLRPKLNSSKAKIRLAYFGRLAGNKGLSLLVKALSTSSISQKIILDLWGQGVEEGALRRLVAELSLETQVRFLGKYPQAEEGARLMASYDALVLCSTEMEGLPLILLEAMAYGVPFMATDVGAIRDCCVNNPDAILVQPTQETITQGIQILVGRIEADDFDPVRLKNFYEKTFSYEVMAARWRECVQNPNRFFYES